MFNNHDPDEQISRQNPWYIDDHFSKQYDRPGPRAVIENRWRVFETVLTNLFQFAQKPPSSIPARILDAGCGDGINLLGLRNIVRARGWNARVFGTDYNLLRLKRASKISFIEGINQSSLDALPYPKECFDVVLCNQVIEHIPQNKKVLQELKRVIRTEGMLILGVPNEGCFLGWLRNHVIQRSILRTTDHVHFYTQQSISNLVTEAGFSILKIERAGFLVPQSVFYYILSYTKPGRRLLYILGKLWKSQCAELIIVLIKQLKTERKNITSIAT